LRKLLVSLALVCALSSFASAGGPEQPGVEPDPTPTPTPEEFGAQSSSAPSLPFVVVVVNGVPVIIWL
jgi:hypothetical protein